MAAGSGWVARLDAALATVGELAGVDPAGLDAEEQLDWAVGFARLRNMAAAVVGVSAGVIAETPEPAGSAGSARWVVEPAELAAAELGAALGMGSRGAHRLVSIGLAMRERLPGTTALALAGELGWEKVAILAENTGNLTVEQTARVEAKVLPAAATRSPAQHTAAVRRAVAHAAPASLAEQRGDAAGTVELVREHVGGAMGELFARLPSEQLELIWLAADAWARARKADGDPADLPRLRVAALVRWASDYLTRTRPHRHGRPVLLNVSWALTSLLGLDDQPGVLADSGEPLPAEVMRQLLTAGAQLRRMIIDLDSGELIDLAPASWPLPAAHGHGDPDGGGVIAPVELRLIVDLPRWQAIRRQDPTFADHLDALAALPDRLRRVLTQLLHAPLTADQLDGDPHAPTPSAALADWVITRYRHPANPTAGSSAAGSGDLDHIDPRSRDGMTIRANLHPPARRWHRLRTHGGWQLDQHHGTIVWTSPRGRRYYVHPFDYRHGP